MRLAYLGTPEMAVPPLRAIVEAGHEVELVVTRDDRRRGRGTALSPSPVKAAATELGLAVTTDIDDILALDGERSPELGVVVAYGRLIKSHILAALPMVNVHFSLLPRWRGAAPVERALLAGDAVTGVCVMAVEQGLDTGGVYASRELPIGPRATAAELRDELVDIGTQLLLDVLAEPLPEPEPQRGDSTYADKIDAGELEIDWSRPAAEIDLWVRVGGAWTTFRGRRLKVHEVEPVAGSSPPGQLGADRATVGTGSGSVRLVTVQPEGRPPMPWTAFANGAHPQPGERFGRTG